MYRLLAWLLCFMSLFFIACGDSKSSDSKDGKKVVRVGMEVDYPPFEFKKDGKVIGFDVDMLDAIAKKAGFDYEITNMTFDAFVVALKGGKIDMVISSMSATDERRKQVDFSIPYYEGKTLYIKRKESTDIVDKDSLKNKKVGVYIGTVQEQGLLKIKKDYNIDIVTSENIFGAILNLKNKKVDVAAADAATAVGYLKENDDLIGFYEEPDGSEGLSVAFDKGKQPELLESVNKAIKELRESGEYDKILEKWDLK